MKPQRDNKNDFPGSKPGLSVIKSTGPKKKKKRSSGNFFNIRVDLDSRRYDGPLRLKIRQLVAEEVIRIFTRICRHCNRRYEYEGRKKPVLSLIASPELTDRQKEIMDLVVLKKSDRQISKILGIEISTVKNHMKNIKTKLGIHTRSDARDQYLRIKEEDAEKKNQKIFGLAPETELGE